MPLIENEIIGDEVVQSDGQFHQNQIVPLVTGLSVVNLIQENIALYGDASWMVSLPCCACHLARQLTACSP